MSDDLAEMKISLDENKKMYEIVVEPKQRKQFAKVIDTKAGRKKESIERVIRKTESLRKRKHK